MVIDMLNIVIEMVWHKHFLMSVLFYDTTSMLFLLFHSPSSILTVSHSHIPTYPIPMSLPP